MEQNNKSDAYQLVELVWTKENTNSYLRLNTLMFDAVCLAIQANMAFDSECLIKIKEKFRGEYWFGANTNGKGMGEGFYSRAVSHNNNSACKAYETLYDFKPFIKDNSRAYNGKYYFDRERRYRVTGFDFEKKTITLVSYELSDRKEEGTRKLHAFTNKEWLEFRKNITE